MFGVFQPEVNCDDQHNLMVIGTPKSPIMTTPCPTTGYLVLRLLCQSTNRGTVFSMKTPIHGWFGLLIAAAIVSTRVEADSTTSNDCSRDFYGDGECDTFNNNAECGTYALFLSSICGLTACTQGVSVEHPPRHSTPCCCAYTKSPLIVRSRAGVWMLKVSKNVFLGR